MSGKSISIIVCIWTCRIRAKAYASKIASGPIDFFRKIQIILKLVIVFDFTQL